MKSVDPEVRTREHITAKRVLVLRTLPGALSRVVFAMPDIEDKPTPEAVADTVEQAAEEIVQDVKEVKEDVTDSTAGASLSDALASVKSGLATVKGWSQAAGRTAGGAWATVGSWKEQGTGFGAVL